MTYTVIARKWRPQNFEDVVGQKTITQTLQNAIRSNRVGHAFLFSGPRGVGKTTVARILARALNCHRGPTPQPCGECPSCLEIAAGNALDVLEIDAASNTGVDNIRELRETLQYRTARDRFKIFIIDEVHMLSNAAFNALLKTLEEPPEHVKFIMATTEPHRIPVTILSRCQQFEFKMIPYQQIFDRLRLIAQREGIEISDYALRLVCSASEGSMRDAQSALDQILAFSGAEVRDEDVRSLLGVIAEDSLNAVVDSLIKRDRKQMLDQLSEIARHGHDLQVFCRKLLEHFRHLLVIKAAGFHPDMIPVTSAQANLLKEQSENFSEIDLLRSYDLMFRAESELRWHSVPLFHLEITLLKVLQLPHLEEIEKVLAGTKAAGGTGGAKSAPKSSRPVDPGGQEDEPEKDGRNPLIQSVLENVHQQRPSLSAFLERAGLEITSDQFTIRFGPRQKFARQCVEEKGNLELLERICAGLTGSPCRVRIESEEPDSAPPETKSHRALQDPRVQLFREAFPGKISIEDLPE
ncbi:MAG TPA: DNA polymerase III subunit gamma/tau [Acidobacteriota bacterium]|jgi:DNA polymerase-3 subunit gamma/tau